MRTDLRKASRGAVHRTSFRVAQLQNAFPDQLRFHPRGILRREDLTAYLMGPGRLYPIPGSSLAAG